MSRRTKQALGTPYVMTGRNFNRIFNIGLNKSGTRSLVQALDQLGFPAVHYRHEGTRLVDIVRRNRRRKLPLLHGLEDYDAFSDMAGEYYFHELDREYPDSKFILTVRDMESWLDSRERHVRRNKADPHYAYAFLKIDRQGWSRHFHLVTERVQHYFSGRPASLLVMNIPAGDGWQVLCPFLDVPAPALPFPCVK